MTNKQYESLRKHDEKLVVLGIACKLALTDREYKKVEKMAVRIKSFCKTLKARSV